MIQSLTDTVAHRDATVRLYLAEIAFLQKLVEEPQDLVEVWSDTANFEIMTPPTSSVPSLKVPARELDIRA